MVYLRGNGWWGGGKGDRMAYGSGAGARERGRWSIYDAGSDEHPGKKLWEKGGIHASRLGQIWQCTCMDVDMIIYNAGGLDIAASQM